jgi:hypothetical protein
MSNRIFLVAVGAIMVVFLGVLLVQKYEDCATRGGKACPRARLGVSFDPHEQLPR